MNSFKHDLRAWLTDNSIDRTTFAELLPYKKSTLDFMLAPSGSMSYDNKKELLKGMHKFLTQHRDQLHSPQDTQALMLKLRDQLRKLSESEHLPKPALSKHLRVKKVIVEPRESPEKALEEFLDTAPYQDFEMVLDTGEHLITINDNKT